MTRPTQTHLPAGASMAERAQAKNRRMEAILRRLLESKVFALAEADRPMSVRTDSD